MIRDVIPIRRRILYDIPKVDHKNSENLEQRLITIASLKFT